MPELNSYFPSYTGTDTWDQPLKDPWWIPGWTSQNRDEPEYEVPAGTGNFYGPGYPTNLVEVTIRGNYFDGNSSGIAGFVTVMMSDSITVEDSGTYYRLPQRLTGTMRNWIPFAYNNWGNGVLYLVMGHLDINVFATDQTTSGSTITTDSGNPFTYYVTEHFMGGRTYQITVPSSDAPGPVDINSLIIAGTVMPYAYDPVNPMGNMLIPIPEPPLS